MANRQTVRGERADRGEDNGINSDAVGVIDLSVGNSKKLHTLTPFNQKLFGSNTGRSGPLSKLNGVCDWVSELGDGTIGLDQTVAITPDKYLSGSVRYPDGTASNWIIWADQYTTGENSVYGNIFKFDSWYESQVTDSIADYGQPIKYPIDNFCTYCNDYVPDAQIHAVLNIYTQTDDEVKASIDQFKVALNDDARVINWELGNETYATSIGYDEFVNGGPKGSGAFSDLSGDDLARAKLIFPSEFYTADAWAARCAVACRYIRENYPNDKIGVTSERMRRWTEPGGGPNYWVTAANETKAWATAQKKHIPDEDYDAVILHQYYNMTQTMATDLSGVAIPASGKEMDATFTDQDDRFWRHMATQGQYLFRNTMDDANELYPSSKEVWLTEYGSLSNSGYTLTQLKSGTTTGVAANKLIDGGGGFSGVVNVGDWVTAGTGSTTYVTAVDSDTQLSVNADIFTSGNDYRIYLSDYPEGFVDEYTNDVVYRGLTMSMGLISIATEYLRWRGVRELATSCMHTMTRNNGFISTIYTSGYLKHQGAVCVMFDEAIKNATSMCLPILNDASVQYDGMHPLEHIKFNPVTALFTQGADQWAYIVNNSPSDRTVTVPFATSSGKKLVPVSSPPDPFEFLVADATYDTYSDLPDTSDATGSITVEAFSIYTIKNTGAMVTLDDYTMTVA